MWPKSVRYAIVFTALMLILSATLVLAQSPSVNVSLSNNDTCGRDVIFHLSGFTPNSPIIVDNNPNVIQEYECDGILKQGAGWVGWDIGQSTDGNGNLDWAVRHGAYGSYEYVFHDGAGLTANVRFSYESSYTPTQVPPSDPTTTEPTLQPTTIPPTLVPPTIPPTLSPPTSLPPCPSGVGPGGITAGSYPPQDLTQEQRQWLWNIFGNNPNEQAPVGYGGQGCSGGGQSTMPICPSGVGPGGITAGSYPPQDLTQEQRQWLWNIFGNNPNEQAPVGYGGQGCSGGNAQPPLPECPAGVGPGNITAGSYRPQDLTQEQRQWLWNIFGNNPNEQAPAGYGGQECLEHSTQTDTDEPSENLQTFSGWISPPYTGDYALVTIEGLRLRQGPGMNHIVQGFVKQNNYYILHETIGAWGRISAQEKEGFIHLRYTTIFRVSQAPDETLQQLPLNYDLEGAVEANGSAQLVTPTCYQTIEARAHFRPNRGGFVLEIMETPLPPIFEVYHLGILVPDHEHWVAHNIPAGEPTGTSFFLGIGTRYLGLFDPFVLLDSTWEVRKPC